MSSLFSPTGMLDFTIVSTAPILPAAGSASEAAPVEPPPDDVPEDDDAACFVTVIEELVLPPLVPLVLSVKTQLLVPIVADHVFDHELLPDSWPIVCAPLVTVHVSPLNVAVAATVAPAVNVPEFWTVPVAVNAVDAATVDAEDVREVIPKLAGESTVKEPQSAWQPVLSMLTQTALEPALLGVIVNDTDTGTFWLNVLETLPVDAENQLPVIVAVSVCEEPCLFVKLAVNVPLELLVMLDVTRLQLYCVVALQALLHANTIGEARRIST